MIHYKLPKKPFKAFHVDGQKIECPICKYFKDRGVELKSEDGKPIKINKELLK